MQIVMTDMQVQLMQPDIVLRPDTSKYYYIDDVNPQELIGNGHSVVEENLDEIKRAIENFTPQERKKPELLLSEYLEEKS